MSSTPLTPQEFEDQYLNRSAHERPKKDDKEVVANRIAMKDVFKTPTEVYRIFKMDEGVDARVQEYYDASFDKAFEGMIIKDGHSDAKFRMDRFGAVKLLKSENVAWGRMSGIGDSIVIKSDGDKPEGVIVLHTMGNIEGFDRQQLNIYLEQEGDPPIIALIPEPLSWKMAAINLAGAISRLIYLDESFSANMDEATKRFAQEVMSAEVQIDLADHLSNGIFSNQIRRTLDEHYKIADEDQFLSKMRIKEWSLGLTGHSFGRMNPPLGESEELMRGWLCRMAALRHFAHKRAGKKADSQTKLQEFSQSYRNYGDKFNVRYDYIRPYYS